MSTHRPASLRRRLPRPMTRTRPFSSASMSSWTRDSRRVVIGAAARVLPGRCRTSRTRPGSSEPPRPKIRGPSPRSRTSPTRSGALRHQVTTRAGSSPRERLSSAREVVGSRVAWSKGSGGVREGGTMLEPTRTRRGWPVAAGLTHDAAPLGAGQVGGTSLRPVARNQPRRPSRGARGGRPRRPPPRALRRGPLRSSRRRGPCAGRCRACGRSRRR